jgi:Short C-terminal domain
MSTFVLLYFVARRREDDDDFLNRLGYAAARMGALSAADEISVLHQGMPALMTAVDAWKVADTADLWDGTDAWNEPDGIEQGAMPNATGEEGVGSDDSALQIVRERYARGEISRDEYRQMIADLGGS